MRETAKGFARPACKHFLKSELLLSGGARTCSPNVTRASRQASLKEQTSQSIRLFHRCVQLLGTRRRQAPRSDLPA